MLYILPNPGNGPRKNRKKARPASRKIARRGPGLPQSLRPPVWRPPARGAHPASKRRGGRKIQGALGKGKWYRHRIVFWSKSGKGGDEGVRTPYYVKGNNMARRRRKSRYGRRRRRNSVAVMPNRRRRRIRRYGRRRRNPVVVMPNRRRRRKSRRSRRNYTVATNRRRRRSSRRRRNPVVVMPNRRRRRRSRRNGSVMANRRHRRRGSRRYSRRRSNPLAAISGGLSILKPANFIAQTKRFAGVALQVGVGYVGVRLLDAYVFGQAWLRFVAPFNEGKSEFVQKAVNTLWDTATHLVTASVGGGLASKFRVSPTYFLSGVAVNWLRKMAIIWLPEGQLKAALAGYDDDMNDWVESYNLPNRGRVNDYVEQDSMGDYVEVTR